MIGSSRSTDKEIKNSATNIRRLAIMAVFIALSAVGALIKIPSPIGTVGLDSAAGFFCALAFGGLEGAVVISLGHLFTSAIVGFPSGIPMHLIIALEMAVFALAYRYINKKLGLVAAVVVAVLLNGVAGSFTLYPVGGMGLVISLMPFLVLGAILNIVVSALAYKALKGTRLI